MTGPVFTALAAAVIAAGCASARSPGPTQVVSAMNTANPVCTLERESRLVLGGARMWAVKTLVRLSDESDGAEILSHIRRVDLATYRAAGPSACSDESWLETFREEVADRGWTPVVIERDGTGSSWVFSHAGPGGDLDGLLVVEFDGRELEVVRCDGSIDRLLAEAVAEEPGAVAAMVRNAH